MIDINLIAARRAQQQRAIRILRVATYSVIGLAVAAAALFAWLTVAVNTVEAQISQCEARLTDPKLAQALERIEHLEAENRELAPRVELLEKVRGSQRRWMQVLEDVSTCIPEDVWLTGISSKRDMRGQVLKVTGSALSQRDVGDFMLKLKTRSWCDPPELGFTQSVKSQDREVVTFEISVPLKKPIGSDLL
jgi:Tfp pilus assembly protein PilN